MKKLNRFALTLVAALLIVAGGAINLWHPDTVEAQSQGAQTLSTTTLSQLIPNVNGGSGITSNICLASLTNVTATVSVQTTLYVDTEAMAVVTNTIPPSGTCITVTRGAYGTKAEGHQSGRTVYVGRPNLFQGYDVSGTCWSNAAGTATLPAILPWINLTTGNVFNCGSDGNWYRIKVGSQWHFAGTAATGFCTGAVTASQTEYLNGAACAGATTSTYTYLVSTPGEVANLNVASSANVAGAGDPVTVYRNGVATAVTCTIAAAAKTCSDTTHSFSTAVGDLITFQIVTGAGDTAANVSATVGIYGD